MHAYLHTFKPGLLVPFLQRVLEKGTESRFVSSRNNFDINKAAPSVSRRYFIPEAFAVIVLPPLDAGCDDLIGGVVLHHQSGLQSETSRKNEMCTQRYLNLQQSTEHGAKACPVSDS